MKNHKIQCKKWDRKMVTITTHSIMYPNLFIDEVIFFGVFYLERMKNGDIILFCLVHCMFDKHLNQFYFVKLVHHFNRKWNQINRLFFTSNQMHMDQIKTDRCFNLQSLNLKSLYEIPFNLFVIYQVMCNQASEKKSSIGMRCQILFKSKWSPEWYIK